MKEIIDSMENKYYTPEIRDLYVGYECEAAQVKFPINDNDWYKTIIFERDFKESFPRSFGHNDTFSIWSFPLRTPFLTQAQIEAEGFQLLAKSVDLWFKFKESPVTHTKIQDFYKYRPSNLFLNYGLHDCRLIIKCDFLGDNDFDKADTLFKGYCPSINELRSIFKLLKIK